MGRLGLVRLAFGLKLLVQFHCLGDGGTGRAFFLELIGGWPVHQRVRHLLPLAAFRAEVAHAVAFHFPFRCKLVGAVLQDEALGQLLGGDAGREDYHASGESRNPCPRTLRIRKIKQDQGEYLLLLDARFRRMGCTRWQAAHTPLPTGRHGSVCPVSGSSTTCRPYRREP